MTIDWDSWDEMQGLLAPESRTDVCPDCSREDRTRQAKWDKKNLRTVSTKLRKEEYAALLDVCMLSGAKPYTVLRRLIKSQLLGR